MTGINENFKTGLILLYNIGTLKENLCEGKTFQN